VIKTKQRVINMQKKGCIVPNGTLKTLGIMFLPILRPSGTNKIGNVQNAL
jgi:hypothetical protein